MKNPDNLGISSGSLMIQEDVSSGFESRTLRYDPNAGALSVVARVDTIGWESSGIVDASAFFGDGAWLLDVQAHSILVDEEQVGDLTLTTRGWAAHGRRQLNLGGGARWRAPPAG